MLSYRHAFHAGNHADVLKHLVLVLTLDYYRRKDKAFWYIDTHAGSGLYPLHTAEAQKNREYHNGVQTLWAASNPPANAELYLALLRQLNLHGSLQHYPGSPWFAAQLLRPQDQLRLFELHPSDCTTLKATLGTDKRVRIEKHDGLAGLIGLLPPLPRRAVTLIDPSYELKTDYTAVISTLQKAHQRFATGTYLLWYPVVERQRVEQMRKALLQSGIPDILQVEFCPQPDNTALGMTGSGLFVLNPPWVLAEHLRQILPWLNQCMAAGQGQCSVVQLTKEA